MLGLGPSRVINTVAPRRVSSSRVAKPMARVKVSSLYQTPPWFYSPPYLQPGSSKPAPWPGSSTTRKPFSPARQPPGGGTGGGAL